MGFHHHDDRYGGCKTRRSEYVYAEDQRRFCLNRTRDRTRCWLSYTVNKQHDASRLVASTAKNRWRRFFGRPSGVPYRAVQFAALCFVAFTAHRIARLYDKLSLAPISVTAPAEVEIPEPMKQRALRKPAGVPVRIQIASIGVDAPIEGVGLASDFSMLAPTDPMDAGWYALGPKPGDTGSAVIAGHVNWFHGQTGVFAQLSALKPGDRITVVDEEEETTFFVVRSVRTYDADANAADVFRSLDGGAHLNLITCSGVWDTMTSKYSTRLVVFADLLPA